MTGTGSIQGDVQSLNDRIRSVNRSIIEGTKRSELQNQRLELMVKQLKESGIADTTIDLLSQQIKNSRKALDSIKSTPIKEIDIKK